MNNALVIRNHGVHRSVYVLLCQERTAPQNELVSKMIAAQYTQEEKMQEMKLKIFSDSVPTANKDYDW